MLNVNNIRIEKDSVSGVLQKRWIACYLLYDLNYRHASNAFYNNEYGRHQRVVEMIGDDFVLNDELLQSITQLYNKVLAEDIESFIQEHLSVWAKDRLEVELGIAEAYAELYEQEGS